MSNTEINWELLNDEFNKFFISSPLNEDWRTTIDRFFKTRSQDSRYFKDARPRYDVIVRNLAKQREEATMYKIDLTEVEDMMNRFLPDISISEKKYFMETVQLKGNYVRDGKGYSLFVKLSENPRSESEIQSVSPAPYLFDVVVKEVGREDNEEVDNRHRISGNRLVGLINKYLPDIPHAEQMNLIKTARVEDEGFKAGKNYSMKVTLSLSEKVELNHIQKNVQAMMELHKTAVEELTEAIRFTAEYLGPDKLPAIEGWSWYDALVKYAPEKAAKFELINPVDKALPFVVMIINEKDRDAERERTRINRGGLADILEDLTDLNDMGRKEFLSKLHTNGHAGHIGHREDIKHYTIMAVNKDKYHLDSNGTINAITDAKGEV